MLKKKKTHYFAVLTIPEKENQSVQMQAYRIRRHQKLSTPRVARMTQRYLRGQKISINKVLTAPYRQEERSKNKTKDSTYR